LLKKINHSDQEVNAVLSKLKEKNIIDYHSKIMTPSLFNEASGQTEQLIE
jgi:transcription initiation factor IIE alpha subunit